MEKIRTATGKEFPVVSVTGTNNRLYIRLQVSISDAAAVFENAAETREMWLLRANQETPTAGSPRYALWTKLIAIVPEGAWVRVVLAKE